MLRVSYCDRSLSVVVHRPSCVNFFTYTSFPLKPLIGFWPNFTGMIPGWSPIKVVQIFPVGCISRSQIMPVGSKLTLPGGHNFTLNYIRKTANDFFFWTANGNLTKLNRNGPWVVPYRNCSNGSDWLHKKVTGSKNRFSKCNFKKSYCPKLQGPGLSSTKVVQIMPLGLKLN